MALKIYTKTGDKGKTSLFGGKRVSKASVRVETYGTMDELQAALGVAKTHLHKQGLPMQTYLTEIQTDLFELCSLIATPTKTTSLKLKQRIVQVEVLIDAITEKLPELKNFIYPDGGQAGAQLHLARAICRRLERRLVALSEKEEVDNQILIYFNRLSDFLFTMARYANHREGVKETIWKQ